MQNISDILMNGDSNRCDSGVAKQFDSVRTGEASEIMDRAGEAVVSGITVERPGLEGCLWGGAAYSPRVGKRAGWPSVNCPIGTIDIKWPIFALREYEHLLARNTGICWTYV